MKDKIFSFCAIFFVILSSLGSYLENFWIMILALAVFLFGWIYQYVNSKEKKRNELIILVIGTVFYLVVFFNNFF